VYERGAKQGEIGSPRLAVRSGPPCKPVEQRDEVEMLSLMLLIRRFEERASQQYQAQKIGGFCHLYISQEAVVTGAAAAVRPDDYIITAYRDHGHALPRWHNRKCVHDGAF
jgi:pyruvate dehydrogenase E1 component alpha subunit